MFFLGTGCSVLCQQAHLYACLVSALVCSVMELCGGMMEDLSTLELMKRDDVQFQVVDETDYEDEIPDELGDDETYL